MTFIDKTKTFLKQRPVRIVISIIVIVSIMVGVAFGIIALFRVISDKCANEVGYPIWNDNINTCVASCPGGKTANLVKGTKYYRQCVPDNYCKTQSGKYIYDDISGKCILKYCPDGSSSIGDDGVTSTDMNKDGDYWKPKTELFCGKKCSYSKTNCYDETKAGNGWCPANAICGQYVNGDTGKRIDSDFGCFNCDSSNQFKLCTGNNPKNIVCPDGNCMTNTGKPDGTVIGCKLNTCKIADTSNSLGLSDKIYACKTNTDCGTGGICKFDNAILNEKGISKSTSTGNKGVGYCSAISDDKYEPDKNCMKLGQLGYYVNESKKINEIIKCSLSGKNQNLGVYNNDNKGSSTCPYTQCPKAVENLACAKNGICNYNSNQWEAKLNNNDHDSKICKNSSTPCIQLGDCCASEYQAIDPATGNKFCCGVQTTPVDGKQYCGNITEYPYSEKLLTGNGKNQQISCTQGEDLSDYTRQLRKNLDINNDKFPNKLYIKNNTLNPWYTTTYCDIESGKTKGTVKAICGAFNSPNTEKSTLAVGNIKDKKNPISFCINTQKNNACNTSPLNWPHDTINNDWPICHKPGQDGLYWTSKGGDDTGYIATPSMTISNSNGKKCTEPMKRNECNKILKNKSKLGFKSYELDTQGTGGSICTFTQSCDDAKVPVTVSNKSHRETSCTGKSDEKCYELDIP